MTDISHAGTFTLGGRTVNRMGYGAMQLAGRGVFGPPRDRAEAVAVLRAAVDAGVTHIDTSDFYGPHVTNQIIKEALHPYPDDLVIVTKVGARRDDTGAWLRWAGPEAFRQAVHDNLRNLGLERLEVVNYRAMGMGDAHGAGEGSIGAEFEALARLREEGLIAHLGVSTVTPTQIKEAQAIAPIVCVQNHYNLAHRADDAMIDDLAAQGIAYVPYFPLGGFSPLQSGALDAVASDLGVTPMQAALAWLLHRSPNMLLIPGTSSRGHLKENLAAGELELPEEALAKLDAIGGSAHPFLRSSPRKRGPSVSRSPTLMR